jgi:microcystin-dependent protein
MASTYTSNLGIEKPATGEQSGAWGDTTNTNFDIIDRGINGVVDITLAGTTHTLTTSDGALSEGGHKVLVLGGSPSGTNTITISPNDQEKLYFVANNSGQSAIFTQGSGSNVTVANGKQAIIFADGAGSTAAVNSISTLSDGDIDTAQLADNAVTTAKIADNNVTTAKINAAAVTEAKIATDAVTNAKMADDSVGADELIDNSVGAAAINISGNGTSGQYVTSDGDGSFSYTTPPVAFLSGMIMPYAGASAPSGWLLLYGQAVNRTTYSDLFAVLGTTYGSGDGSTTFNVPDLRGRTIAGQDDMGGSSANRLTDQSGGVDGDTLGASGGTEQHTLTEAEMADHSHLVVASGDVGGSEFSDITIPEAATRAVSSKASYNNVIAYALAPSGSGNEPNIGKSSDVGSDTAHNNVQPTFILNYIIKT